MSKQARFLIASFLLFSSLGLIAYFWGRMPSIIPTHINASGIPDGYGKKLTVLIFPALEAFFCGLYALIIFTMNRPLRLKQLGNTPVNIQLVENLRNRMKSVIDWVMVCFMVWVLDLQIEISMVAVKTAQRLSNLPWWILKLMLVGCGYHLIRLVFILFQAIKGATNKPPSPDGSPPGIA